MGLFNVVYLKNFTKTFRPNQQCRLIFMLLSLIIGEIFGIAKRQFFTIFNIHLVLLLADLVFFTLKSNLDSYKVYQGYFLVTCVCSIKDFRATTMFYNVLVSVEVLLANTVVYYGIKYIVEDPPYKDTSNNGIVISQALLSFTRFQAGLKTLQFLLSFVPAPFLHVILEKLNLIELLLFFKTLIDMYQSQALDKENVPVAV